MRSRTFHLSALIVLGLLASLSVAGRQRAEAGAMINVTANAVQTIYRAGVPHTDWDGNPLLELTGGESFFPIGIYYPEPCRRPHNFSWPRFTNTSHANWSVFVDGGRNYDIAVFLDGENANDLGWAIYTEPEIGTGTQQRTLDELPTGHTIYYEVTPAPRLYFMADAVLASGTFFLSCPPSDPDDPNIVQTLSDAGFTSLITGGFDINSRVPIQHPKIYTDLKAQASITKFSFIINSRFGDCGNFFPEQLFRPASEGGQGYSQNQDIIGWQLEDEPLFNAAWQSGACLEGPTCNSTNMQIALQRITDKYNSHNQQTSQVIFAVEASDWGDSDHQVFPCDPYPYWEQFISLGDVASHDNYPSWNVPGVPYSSTYWIAKSVSHQTAAVNQEKPSWYTTQAFSANGNGYPSPQRVRAAVYTAIVHGATGIWYFAWDSYATRVAYLDAGIRPTLPLSYAEQAVPGEITQATKQDGEDTWDTVASLNNELIGINSAILWPTSRESYQVLVSRNGYNSSSPIRTMLKSRPGNLHYLIAVNMDNTPVDAEFQFSHDLIWKQVLYHGGAGASLSGSGSTMTDTFAPFAAKVYQIIFASTFVDPDNDGVNASIDNCDSTFNPLQQDGNGNGIGTGCDPSESSGVGGIAGLPEIRTAESESPRSDADHSMLLGLSAVAVGLIALGGAAWYTRRRWAKR